MDPDWRARTFAAVAGLMAIRLRPGVAQGVEFWGWLRFKLNPANQADDSDFIGRKEFDVDGRGLGLGATGELDGRPENFFGIVDEEKLLSFGGV